MTMTLALALYIFGLRVLDVSTSILRLNMVMRGQKLPAWVFGFIQALLYVLAIRAVLLNLDNWLNVLAYATGYATGTVVGMRVEQLLALGHMQLRIISPTRGPIVAEHLREKGYAVTEMSGRGKDGMVSVLMCTILRKDAPKVEALVKEKDSQAFITSDRIRPVARGFWKH
jgi:uncharacterized protein YebE (UPF0316 family)